MGAETHRVDTEDWMAAQLAAVKTLKRAKAQNLSSCLVFIRASSDGDVALQVVSSLRSSSLLEWAVTERGWNCFAALGPWTYTAAGYIGK